MVRVYGAQLSDITDRGSRKLGKVYGHHILLNEDLPLLIAGNDGLIVSPKPWWCYDQYGEAHIWDDFEGALKWTQTAGTISKASDTGYTFVNNYALKMTTGAVAGDAAACIRYATPPQPRTGYMSLEIWWALSAVAEATPGSFALTWTIDDHTLDQKIRVGLRYLHYEAGVARYRAQYLNSAGAWENFVPILEQDPVNVQVPQFNYWLLILARTIGVGYAYKMYAFNERQRTFQSTAVYTEAHDRSQQYVTLTVSTDTAAATTAYVGAIIMTDGVYYDWA